MQEHAWPGAGRFLNSAIERKVNVKFIKTGFTSTIYSYICMYVRMWVEISAFVGSIGKKLKDILHIWMLHQKEIAL